MSDSYEGKVIDYRDSHTRVGKGNVYNDSFDKYSFRREMWVWEQKQLDKIFAERHKEGHSILDFACGTGRILKYLSSKSDKVTGVDISEVMLDVCRKRVPNVNLVHADLTRDNVLKEKQSYDIITSFRFFLNAQNELRVEVLNVLRDLLKDDGVFIFNNHGNSLHLGYPLAKIICGIKNIFLSKEKKIYNLNGLSEAKMKSLLDENGFEIVDSYHRAVLPIVNEKTAFNVSKIEAIENWLSSKSSMRIFAKSVIYVCQKKS